MLNILFNPRKAERHPFEMILVGFFYASISILLGAWVFPDQASLVMVFFTVLSCLYVIQGALRIEENKDRDYKSEEWLLKEHSKLLFFLLCLFLGFVFAFSFWTLVIPEDQVVNYFSLQKSVFEGIKEMASTGNSVNPGLFNMIFFNNIKVLLISLIFAFFYGAGAIFVLAWNASVIAGAIGIFTKYSISQIPMGLLRYMIHGFPEITAYFIVALAGGMFGLGALRHGFKDKKFWKVIQNVVLLIAFSIVILIAAALMEVYLTPLLF